MERYAYTPYGVTTVLDADFSADADNKSDIANVYLYTGRRYDRESGLQLNRNRFYNQQLGRWMNRDPIGYGGGVNLYEYVGGMPLVKVDPSGRIAPIIIGGGVYVAWMASCSHYARSAAKSAFENDKEVHCMTACLYNKCMLWFQPWNTLGGMVGWELGGGWSDADNDSEQDIGAGAQGIVTSYFADCKDGCEGCDKQWPVSDRPPSSGGWNGKSGGGGF